MTSTLPQLAADITAFIRSAEPSEESFNRLALELFAFQFDHNAGLRTLCAQRRLTSATVSGWKEIPAAPAAAFKGMELTTLPPAERIAVFHSSGTTGQRPSRHFHSIESLAVYEESLLRWFEPHLRVEGPPPLRPIFLTPPPAEAPHSSLVHMFETIRRAYPANRGAFYGKVGTDGSWHLRSVALLDALDAGQPVALLGTAFNFVHLLDFLAGNGRSLALAPGSRLMETGGYKGRSRTLPKDELHAALLSALGVPRDHIVCEYGMSELSSQAYSSFDALLPARRFRFPRWARVQIICPETGREAAEGDPGLVRVCDLANVASALVVQTEDLAIRHGDGFEWLGRAVSADPRGCSLMTG